MGYRKVVNIIELELVLREMETFGLMRDPERYHITFYGTPSRTERWGWRFEGHHLSLNFALAGEGLVVDTPSFFGANPATVPSGRRGAARWATSTTRMASAGLARTQRREAVISTRTYGDIVTSNRPRSIARSGGDSGAKLDEGQRALVWKIVELYASSFEPGLAEARLARARQDGLESLRFGWAGSTMRGAPHYYRVQGPRFLIEYDASQDGGNHIHTVWRDFTGDFGLELSAKGAFGRDLLHDHYASARGTTHRHELAGEVTRSDPSQPDRTLGARSRRSSASRKAPRHLAAARELPDAARAAAGDGPVRGRHRHVDRHGARSSCARRSSSGARYVSGEAGQRQPSGSRGRRRRRRWKPTSRKTIRARVARFRRRQGLRRRRNLVRPEARRTPRASLTSALLGHFGQAPTGGAMTRARFSAYFRLDDIDNARQHRRRPFGLNTSLRPSHRGRRSRMPAVTSIMNMVMSKSRNPSLIASRLSFRHLDP